MNRKTLFAALGCALLAFSMMGCNALQTTNHLQSIQLSVKLINGAVPTGQSGTVNLQGYGSTIQLAATGTYSSKNTADLTNKVTYTVIVDPNETSNGADGVLLPPCQAPSCPVGTAPNYTSGTVEYSPTGLITSVDPAECTWQNAAVDPATTPAWSYVGDYIVTASFEGITSQPLYVPVGSAAGVASLSNPTGACGPS